MVVKQGKRSVPCYFIQKKIMELMNSVVKLSKVAESQPQAAFSALSKSLQFEWSYLQRILPNFDNELWPILCLDLM